MKSVPGEFIRLAVAFGVLAAVSVISVAVFGGPAAAETTREACTHDAFRLCSDAIPDVGRTKACLARNRASLSSPCKAAFGAAGHRRHGHRRHRRYW